MQLSKTGTLKTRYLGYGCVFKKNLNGYTLVSTTNPKYTPFIKKTLVESKWDLINEADFTEGEKYEEVYNILINNFKNGQNIFSKDTDIILKKDEEILFNSSVNITLSEPRSVRVTKSNYGGVSYGVTKKTRVGGGSSTSVSKSHEEITQIDTGRVTITNKRFIFAGSKKNVDVNLNKIIGIQTYNNGILLQRTGKQKAEYFTGFDNLAFNYNYDGFKYYFNFDGNMVRAIIQGGINYSSDNLIETNNNNNKISTNTSKEFKDNKTMKNSNQENTETKTENKSNSQEYHEDLLLRYSELLEKGLITREEFDLKKEEIFNSMKKQEKHKNFCPECGFKLPENAIFCPECGYKVE